MPQWEYLVVYIQEGNINTEQEDIRAHANADKYTERLNEFGKGGWELVNLAWDANGVKAAFKREAQ